MMSMMSDQQNKSRSASPLTRVTTSDHLAEVLRDAIEQQAYRPGDRLPTERTLSEKYALPRSAVRGALAQLASDGIVDRRAGSGTYVRTPRTALQDQALGLIADHIAPLQLIDMRSALEPAVTRLAALHASTSDIQRLQEVVEELDACDGDVRRFNACDEQFHIALAEATRNLLMVWLYRQLNDVRGRTRWTSVRDEKLTAERIAVYNGLHREIVAAIDRRDADAAAQAMARHMDEVRTDFYDSNFDG